MADGIAYKVTAARPAEAATEIAIPTHSGLVYTPCLLNRIKPMALQFNVKLGELTPLGSNAQHWVSLHVAPLGPHAVACSAKARSKKWTLNNI
jgi:hypothetical protein